ncbi:MAG: hypothetical protein QOI83_2995 [Streptomycetaceae bacterium]|jgi:hypothetical protein|nr:hypothetical protein [Streptomycetaceae bacterium]
MSAVEQLQELHGLLAFDFPAAPEESGLPEPDSVAWRLSVAPEGGHGTTDFEELWERFLGAMDASRVRALIIGEWDALEGGDSGAAVQLLAAARDRLTALQAVFLGDVEGEEAEQCDVTPVLDAYPALRELGIRGGAGLRFPAVRHASLRTLGIEADGLPAEVVRGVAASELPALEYLELSLGAEECGGDYTADDLAPILAGDGLPALRHLGLAHSDLQDEIAIAVSSAPVVARLQSLDLSLGTLGDEGVEALLEGVPLTHLEWLDLRSEYIGADTAQRIRKALEPQGVEVDLSEPGRS